MIKKIKVENIKWNIRIYFNYSTRPCTFTKLLIESLNFYIFQLGALI